MTKNDVIAKTIAKFRPPRNQANYIFSKAFDNGCEKHTFLSNLRLCVKSYGHICQILA